MIAIGTRLCTKDGRRIGNGIIVSRHVFFSGDVSYLVKTDFGNLVPVSERGLDFLFYITNDVIDPSDQLQDQGELLLRLGKLYNGN